MRTPRSASNTRNSGSRTRSKRGRNPSIDMEKIEAAVREVGSDSEMSMKDVAEHLGVNVTTLYRHMGGLEGLQRIRAAQLAESLPEPPQTRGHSWQSWLSALAHYYRDSLLAYPEMLEFAHAALDPDFEKLEQATSALVEFGFTAQAAATAHGFMINNVLGFVHTEMQTQEDAAQGHASLYARLFEKFASQPERLPTLRSLNISEEMFSRDLNFEVYLKFMIAGIEAQRGVPSGRTKKSRSRS